MHPIWVHSPLAPLRLKLAGRLTGHSAHATIDTFSHVEHAFIWETKDQICRKYTCCSCLWGSFQFADCQSMTVEWNVTVVAHTTALSSQYCTVHVDRVASCSLTTVQLVAAALCAHVCILQGRYSSKGLVQVRMTRITHIKASIKISSLTVLSPCTHCW